MLVFVVDSSSEFDEVGRLVESVPNDKNPVRTEAKSSRIPLVGRKGSKGAA